MSLVKLNIWDLPKLVWRITTFCDEGIIFALMLVSRRFHTLVTHDNVWRDLYTRFNLNALLNIFPKPVLADRSLHQLFLEEIMTTRVLHGRYEFDAAESNDTFNIQHVVFIISEASFGNSRHAIGRGQILITYRSTAEVLQGALRFSPQMRSFVLCCNTFGSTQRGPVFMVAVAQANRKWANQHADVFARHHGGTRLIMTPMIIESITKGSQMTEAEVIAVSKPPLPGTAAAAEMAQREAEAAVASAAVGGGGSNSGATGRGGFLTAPSP